MKALLFGAVLGVLALWPAVLPVAADALRTLTRPAVLVAVLGVLAVLAPAGRRRRWAR
jgi:hypothetical protein